jgi:uncharacterized Zn finger protein
MSTPTDFSQYGKPIRVEGGLRARTERGAIGDTWWSKRFLAVLESLAIGGRLSRGRSYARAGQVLSLEIAPGLVSAAVQGSRPHPYDVTIRLRVLDEPTWAAVEAALAGQAIFSARLLAGDMPTQIEEVFASAGEPLFPTAQRDIVLSCSCPDYQVPCKHLAATFYLVAEAFDADPFQILFWRGRDRDELLTHLRELRSGADAAATRTRKTRSRTAKATGGGPAEGVSAAPIGTATALAGLTNPDLGLDRFWLPPVPLPARPPTLDTEPDLLLRQLPTPGPAAGGSELVARLRAFYARFPPAGDGTDAGDGGDARDW